MRLRYIFLFTIILYGIEVFSQCEGRYEKPIFENVTVNTITYSDVTGFEMDVYTAANDDYTGLKPVVILAHGGSFYLGSKTNPSMVKLGNEFAKRGYIAASIQYTLTDNATRLLDSLHIVEIVMQAIGDGKAAIRWFRKDAAENGNQFNIDPGQIFVGGNSAGGVLMTNLAYIDERDELPEYMETIINNNGGLDGPAGNYGYPSNVNGVLNFAGAVYNPSILANNTEPPIISFHGDMDGVVPYDCNSVFWEQSGDLLVKLCGSSVIHEEADRVGIPNELVVFEGDNHTPWEANSSKMSTLVEQSSIFVYNLLNCTFTKVDDITLNKSVKVFPNPSNSFVTVNFSEFGTFFEIIITDFSGKILLEDVSKSSYYNFSKNNLNSGVYFLFAKNDKFSIKTKIIFN